MADAETIMPSSQYDNLRYENRLPRKQKAARMLWGIAYALLFRPTPRWAMHGWRRTLLRLFGATIGPGCKIAPSCRVFAPWNLVLGELTALAEGVDCYCVDKITIGSMCAVSQRAFLCSASHDIGTLKRDLTTAPIVLGDHVWVCAEAFVGPGVTLGDGVVAGARAVVVRDVEPWKVVATTPGVVIKDRVVRDGHDG
ncbi:MAG: putative colanic acid biosynthesis acetyltransferase [Planctomycetota bacterium]